MLPPIRSLLFAPANEPRKVAKLAGTGADAVVLDLEDAVAKEHKVAARAMARDALATITGPVRCIRVNAWDTGLTPGDVAAIASPDLDVIVLPKVESPRDLARLDAVIAAAMPGVAGPCVLALIETCAGILAAAEIARASPRLAGLVFGAGDLGKDLALPTLRGDISGALAWGRAKLVYDARAAGLPGPIDGPCLMVRDQVAMEAEARAAAALGHRGKVCIHPDQVAVANRVFSPDPGEVAFARRVIAAFAAAEGAGSASITVDGVFVDYPIVEKAEAIVRLAERAG
ncbi:CoA ester lyase [Elioraea sp.]|uniref:HpcH/HpaI aldolase/citrate lyase family protein n=1 Tax=Elioraea sp. TaxID=2185103 RepID=UPI0025BDD345|nr:CoA ester lyase [Elioraea sp.]